MMWNEAPVPPPSQHKGPLRCIWIQLFVFAQTWAKEKLSVYKKIRGCHIARFEVSARDVMSQEADYVTKSFIA